MSRRGTALVVVVLAGLAVTTAAGGGVSASAIHGSPGNWTVVPGDHQPGASGADYQHFAVGQAAWDDTNEGQGLRKVDYMVVTWEEGSFADCTLFNAEAFGFDRGNDDPGTENEDFAGQYIEDFAMQEDAMWMDFYDEDDAGPTTNFDRNDQFVAHQTGCYQNPDERGWYRVHGWMNGTDYAGDHGRAELYSHYFYICDCESREEARATLGPPPSESTPTATPGATPTPTATTAPDGTPAATTTDESAGASTPTAADEGDSTSTATDTASATTADTDDGPSPSPTAGGGPGFTAGLALATLLATALLGLARR